MPQYIPSSDMAAAAQDVRNASADALQPSVSAESIVERAMRILEAQSRDAISAQRIRGALSDPTADPLPSEFEKYADALRERTQDWVGALVRLLERAPAAIGAGQRSSTAVPALSPAARVDTAEMPILRQASAVAGAIAATALGVINDTHNPADIVLRVTNLVSGNGDEIPGRTVSFTPGHYRLPPGAEQPVKVEVQVPRETPPGTYSGLVQVAGLEGVRAVLVLKVEQS